MFFFKVDFINDRDYISPKVKKDVKIYYPPNNIPIKNSFDHKPNLRNKESKRKYTLDFLYNKKFKY